MTKISEKLKIYENTNGLFVFCGIIDTDEEVFEIIEPKIKCDIFYYNCSNKFTTDILDKYMKDYNGSIIFVNGNECFVYSYDGQFKRIKQMNANLIKRHKKGGQSSLRFSRLAEESRLIYVSHVIDSLNLLTTDNNWIFGSLEILNMVINRTDLKIKINNGGFVDFNKDTINDANYWLSYLDSKKNFDKYYDEIVLFLDTNVDMLDFDVKNKDKMKYYLINDESKLNDDRRQIILYKNSKYYEKLKLFEYIGVKYYSFNNDQFDEQINENSDNESKEDEEIFI